MIITEASIPPQAVHGRGWGLQRPPSHVRAAKAELSGPRPTHGHRILPQWRAEQQYLVTSKRGVIQVLVTSWSTSIFLVIKLII